MPNRWRVDIRWHCGGIPIELWRGPFIERRRCRKRYETGQSIRKYGNGRVEGARAHIADWYTRTEAGFRVGFFVVPSLNRGTTIGSRNSLFWSSRPLKRPSDPVIVLKYYSPVLKRQPLVTVTEFLLPCALTSSPTESIVLNLSFWLYITTV